jgi:hypothetical protein
LASPQVTPVHLSEINDTITLIKNAYPCLVLPRKGDKTHVSSHRTPPHIKNGPTDVKDGGLTLQRLKIIYLKLHEDSLDANFKE